MSTVTKTVKFDCCVVVGSGKFAYNCAKLASKYIKNIIIFEYLTNGLVSTLAKLSAYGKVPFYVMEHNGENLLSYLEENKQRKILILSAQNTFIFKAPFFTNDNVEIINYHPALLPKHPGRNSEAWAIYEMDEKTGVTWHWVDQNVDAGQIIASTSIMITTKMTSLELMQLQNKYGIELLEEIIDDVVKGAFIKNVTDGNSLNHEKWHYSRDIPNGGELDWSWPNEKKAAFLRAMDYGRLEILGRPFTYIETRKHYWRDYYIFEHGKHIDVGSDDLAFYGNSIDIVLKGLFSEDE